MPTDYAHPEVLVSTAWVEEHRQDPNVRIVESDEDVLLYQQGHVPGAVKIDWHTDLQDTVGPRLHRQAGLSPLFARAKGIGHDTVVVFYGDKNNWWACYAFWTFKLYGHADCRIMNGGRKRWELDVAALVARTRAPISREPATSAHDPDPSVRAFRDEVLKHQPRRQAAGRRPLAGRIYRRNVAHARLSSGRAPARRAHSRRRQHSLVAGGQRGWHVQVGEGIGKALLQGVGTETPQRHDRLLPHRRAVEPHLVRAQIPAGLPQREELRRLVDRMGQHRRACRSPKGAAAARRNGHGAGHSSRLRGEPESAIVALPELDARLPPRFSEFEPRERLELLLEFAENLPPLPAEMQGRSGARGAPRPRMPDAGLYLGRRRRRPRPDPGRRSARGADRQRIRQHFGRFVFATRPPTRSWRSSQTWCNGWARRSTGHDADARFASDAVLHSGPNPRCDSKRSGGCHETRLRGDTLSAPAIPTAKRRQAPRNISTSFRRGFICYPT